MIARDTNIAPLSEFLDEWGQSLAESSSKRPKPLHPVTDGSRSSGSPVEEGEEGLKEPVRSDIPS